MGSTPSNFRSSIFERSNSQTIGFSDFESVIGYRSGKKIVSQKSPAQLRESIENFHKKSQSVRNNGTYLLGDLANMGQTPLPFVMGDGKTYDNTDTDEGWFASGSSGRQKTVHCAVDYFCRWENFDAFNYFSR